MHQGARRQARQHAIEQEVDVAAGHQDMARVDEQHVAGQHRVEQGRGCGLQGRRHDGDTGKPRDVGTRRGVDRRDLPQARRGLGQYARRMAGANLDDVPRLALAHQHVAHRRIERGEPCLVEQRPQPLELRGMGVEQIDHRGERRLVAFEQRLDGGIGRLRAGRRQQRRIAVRDEPAAGLETEDRWQAELQPPPTSAQGQRAHFVQVGHITVRASALHAPRRFAAGRWARGRDEARPPCAPRRP